jgi:uncharacterized DUF497 family protein
MIFEWDEEKRRKNIEKHNVDFIDAKEIFYDNNLVIIIDNRREYKTFDEKTETRFIAYGMTSKNLKLRVVFTLRGQNYRIITAFRVGIKEWRKCYGVNKS